MVTGYSLTLLLAQNNSNLFYWIFYTQFLHHKLLSLAFNDLRSEWTLTEDLRAFQECLDDRQDPGRDLRGTTGLILVMRRDWRQETPDRTTPPPLVSSWWSEQAEESDKQTRSDVSERWAWGRGGSCPEPLKNREWSEGREREGSRVYISTEYCATFN